jgi:UDP-glucuronate 4-epimerase
MNFIGLRFFTAYGEYNRKDMFLFKLLESIRYDTPVTLYNNGKMKRDFTYCGDIAQVIYYFIDQAFEYNIKRHEIYNLGGGATIEINYAVELLTYHFNKAPNIILNNHIPSHDPTITYCNNEKLMSLSDNNFNFNSFEQGIVILSQWYKKTLD